MTKPIVIIFPDSQKMSSYAAEWLAQTAIDAIAARKRFLISLSGGSTPEKLFQLLAASPYRESLPWKSFLFFWGDERCVAPDNTESNYHQAFETWLAHVPVLEKNIFRIRGEFESQFAAENYASQLLTLAEPGLSFPRIDVALLGLGADGHTASLFPGSKETRGFSVVAVKAVYQDRPANRVSLTPEVFNSARNVLFLVTGKEKSSALASTLVENPDRILLPASRIQPVGGQVLWMVDEAAAWLLPEKSESFLMQHL